MRNDNYKDLLVELVKTSFKLRYNNSFLGFIWVLIRPFATFVILYTVWSAFRGQVIEHYQVKLLLGIILFTFVNEGIIFGMNALLDKSHIILKVNFPREIAVMSSLAMAVINLIINLFVFVIFALFNSVSFSFVGIVWFLVTIVITILIIYGIDLFLSVLLIKLRDLQHIFELFFQLLFWLTPIFYEIGTNPGQVAGRTGLFVSLNPIGMVIAIAREGLIYGRIANLNIYGNEIHSFWILLITFIFAIIMIILGKIYFNREVKRIAEYF